MADPFFKDLAFAALAQTARNPTGDFLQATPRNPILGYLSDLAASSYSPERTQQMQGVAKFMSAPAISETLDRLSYGEPLTTGAGGLGGTTRVRPEALEAAMAVAPTVVPALNMIRPAVKAGARALGPTAVSMGEGYLQRQGLMPGVVPETPGTPLSNMVLDLNKPLSEQSFGVQNALMGKAEYRGGHTAPLKNSGAPLHDLTGGGTVYPDDVYSNTAARYYGAGDPQSDSVLFSKLQSLRNKPDEMVDVWRAVPSEVFKQNSGKQPAFQHGDWVTISRKYAVEHGEGALNGDYKLMRAKFPAKALFTNGDSPYEAGLDLSVLGRNFNDPKMTGSDVVKSFNDPEKAANALSRQGITGIKREPGGITLSTGMQDNNQPVQQAMNEFEQSLINFMATPAK